MAESRNKKPILFASFNFSQNFILKDCIDWLSKRSKSCIKISDYPSLGARCFLLHKITLVSSFTHLRCFRAIRNLPRPYIFLASVIHQISFAHLPCHLLSQTLATTFFARNTMFYESRSKYATPYSSFRQEMFKDLKSPTQLSYFALFRSFSNILITFNNKFLTSPTCLTYSLRFSAHLYILNNNIH